MVDVGRLIVAIRKPGEHKWRVVLHTWSRPYALRVALKWRRKGYDTSIEAIQED